VPTVQCKPLRVTFTVITVILQPSQTRKRSSPAALTPPSGILNDLGGAG